MPRFPYPLKTKRITVYGREYCPYCQKIKKFLEKLYAKNTDKYRYYDIDEIIKEKKANGYADFKEKMRPFIKDYDTIPLVFFEGEFIGGYDIFVQIFDSFNKKNIAKKELINILKNNRNISIEERQKKIINLLKK